MLQITYSFRAQNFPSYTPMHAPRCLHIKENFLLPSWMQVKWPEFQLSVISLEIVHCKKLNVEMQEACFLGMQIAPTGTAFLGCLMPVHEKLMVKPTTRTEQNFSLKMRPPEITMPS